MGEPPKTLQELRYAARALSEKLHNGETSIHSSSEQIDEVLESLKAATLDSPEASDTRETLLRNHEAYKRDIEQRLTQARDQLGATLSRLGEGEDPLALIKAFTEEFRNLSEMLKPAGLTPTLARISVRVLCSLLEGLVYHMKEQAFAYAQIKKIELTSQEKHLVQELEVLPAGWRTTAPTEFKMRTRLNMKRTLQFRARVANSSAPIIGNQLPAELAVVVSVRDRLTHPKRAADFQISATEGKAVARIMEWSLELVKWDSEVYKKYVDEVRVEVSRSFEAKRAELIARLNQQSEGPPILPGDPTVGS